MLNDLSDNLIDPYELSGMPTSTPILVALSGGADSSALLHLLCGLRKKYRFELYAAHLNHGIRTEIPEGEKICEADRDEKFCAKLCKSLSVKLFTRRADIPALARESGKSLETAARDERYRFFAEIMNQNGLKVLATAHNADDNLETQIFNLARGCGVEGISGIPIIRPFEEVYGGAIVRPLLNITKKEILAYCQENGIKYVTDSTNLCSDYTRNAIRNEIIPRLENLTGTPQKNATRLAVSAREDIQYIKSQAFSFLEQNDFSLDVIKLRALDISVAKRVLTIAYAKEHSASLEAVHIDALCKLISGGREHNKISLPDKTRARISCGRIIFEPDVEDEAVKDFCIEIKSGEITLIQDGIFAISSGSDSPEAIEIEGVQYGLYTSARISLSEASLTARNRRDGDVIIDGGMSKKLKKLMCDKKVPIEERNRLPLICDGEGIIYVPFCAIADRVKEKNGQKIIAIYKKRIREDLV